MEWPEWGEPDSTEAGYKELKQGMREGVWKKKQQERPGPHVKVITQIQALTQHFSTSEALPPQLSSTACSLFLTFDKRASKNDAYRNNRGWGGDKSWMLSVHMDAPVCVLALQHLHTHDMGCKLVGHFGLFSLSAPLNPTTLFLRTSFLFSKGAHFL